MYQGVVKDAARIELKKEQKLRQEDYDRQLERRKELSKIQGITNFEQCQQR